MSNSGNMDIDANEDLFGLLVREYYKTLDKNDVLWEQLHGVLTFTRWARLQLQKNPVVGTYTATRGLGLLLQDHTCVPLMVQPPERGMRNEGISITNPGFNPATDWPAASESLPITGKTPPGTR